MCFSGLKGRYLESDVTDAKDIYGVSKMLGEVDNFNTLTLRTSIIGQELKQTIVCSIGFISEKTNKRI